MPSTADTLVKRVRRFVRDWPDLDVLGASLSSGATSLTVADTSSLYHANRQVLEIDQETLYVTGVTNPTTLAVRRGVRGSTAATHTSGASMLVSPRWVYQDVLDGLNSALDASYPWLYKPVIDTSLRAASSVYEYTIPNASNGLPIPYIEWVRILEPGDLMYRPTHFFRIQRGATPKLVFSYEVVPLSTIEIKGVGPLTHLVSPSDQLDATIPYNAEDAFVFYAANWLLLSAEALRDRTDTGVIDKREQATRPGVSMAAANAMMGRFTARLSAAAMPPPGKHLIPTM